MSGQIVSLHEVTRRLSVETGCGQEIAGTFLKEFSSVVSQGLAADGVVNVAGLGIFRVVSDMAGNPSVEFAPDPSLAERVNEPFAMFESVELADSLTESELNPVGDTPVQPGEPAETTEEIHLPQGESDDNAGVPQPLVEVSVTVAGVPAGIPEIPKTQQTPGDVPPPLPPRFSRKEKASETPEPETHVPLADDASEIHVPLADNASESHVPVHDSPEETFDRETREKTMEEQLPEEENVAVGNPLAVRLEPESSVTIQRVGHTTLTLVVSAIAACLLGLILGYLSYKWLNNSLPGNVEILEDGILIRHDSGIVKEEIIPFDNIAEDSLETAQPSTVDSMAVAEAETVPAQQVAQPSTPAVVTDTVGPGNYLSVMARRHYGNAKFWVYIYLENKDKIRNPDNLEDGMVLVIPPASKYGIDASDPASLKKAEREAYKVMPQ